MKQLQRHKELETILVLVLASVALYWKFKFPFFLLLAYIIGGLGLLIPAAGKFIHLLWMKLAVAIGFIMNKLILAVVFIVIVIPFGWLSRKMGKSSIQLKAGNNSFYIDRNHTYVAKDLDNLW